MRFLTIVVMVLGAVGCGAPQPGIKEAPVNVTGTVSQAGRPVGNFSVSFQPLDHGHLKSLPVEPDGTFQGELISGTYAYSVVPSTAAESQQALSKVPPKYLEADLERTVKVEAGREVLIVLD
jgi:hypothetical protein